MIDWNLFSTYLGNLDEPQVVIIIDTFLTDYPVLLVNLKEAAIRKDFPSLTSLAHTIKTNVLWFGATHVGELALRLEVMGRQSQDTGMNEVLQQLETTGSELVRELTRYRENLSGS